MRIQKSLPKQYGTSRQRPDNEGITDGQREKLVRTALTRFVRDKSKPEELETLRYNLIVARVMSGMTAVEAAKKLGYGNSTQLSLIESGNRPFPEKNTLRSLRDFARVYACSVDFLLGLSPHMEPDGRVAHEHAMVRGMEDIGQGIASILTTAIIRYTSIAHPVASEYRRLMNAVDRVEQSLTVMRERFGFDDAPGSAPLLSAVEKLSSVADPLRDKLRQFQSIEDYIADVQQGRMPSIPYLNERYAQHKIAL